MIRGLHEIAFEGGDQDLVHLPPVRVASATYQVEDLTESEESSTRFVVASGPATVDSYAATTTAEAGPGTSDPRVLSVSSIAGVTVGRFYSIEGTRGSEVFRLDDVDANTLVAAQPLMAPHALGATVAGVEVSGTFPSATAANETFFNEDRPFRVLWSYDLEGRPVRIGEQARIVKSANLASNVGPVMQSIKGTHGLLVRQMSGEPAALRILVEECASELTYRLRARGTDPGQFMGGPFGFHLLKAKVLEVLSENGHHPPEIEATEFLDTMRRNFAHKWKDFVGAAPRDTVDVTRDGDGSEATHSRRIRRIGRRM